MNWEVPTVKSRTSFFNTGICLNLLKRCWLLWSGWLGILLLSVTAMASPRYNSYYMNAGDMGYNILSSVSVFSVVICFFSVIVVMAMFSYLYNPRACGMINSLPVKRKEMFLTAYLTGLVPTLLANLVAALVASAVSGENAGTLVPVIFRWLGYISLCCIAFYGFGVFCAMLTGNIVILPIVYLVLNLTALVVGETVSSMLFRLVYGYSSSELISKLELLSPLSGISTEFTVLREGLTVEDGGYILLCAAVGLALIIPSLLLYKKRNMETALDAVAVPVLKPVFRWCLAAGCALVLASIAEEIFFTGAASDKVLLIYIPSLLAGAFIGWFGAEMLIQKSLRVFSKKWKGLCLLWGILLALIMCAELDVTGFEKKVPECSEIKTASVLYYDSAKLTEKENIERTLALQKSIISNKKYHEQQTDTAVTFVYELNSGKMITRRYSIRCIDEGPGSDIYELQELINLKEAVVGRSLPENEVSAQDVTSAEIYLSEGDTYVNYSLTPEALTELYYTAMLPDIEDGILGRTVILPEQDEERYLSVSFEIYAPQTENGAADKHYDELYGYISTVRNYEWKSYRVYSDCTRTLDWIKNNTDIPLD